MTGETRPDGMSAPVHLRLAGMALALGLAGCASVSGTNGGDAAGTSAAAGKEAASSAASASTATSAATDAATSTAGDALKSAGVPTDLSVDNVTGGVKFSSRNSQLTFSSVEPPKNLSAILAKYGCRVRETSDD